MRSNLRPLERRVLAMSEAGLDSTEIGRRLKRSPAHIERIIDWTDIPRSSPAPQRYGKALERRILALRAEGETYDRIAERFRQSSGFIARVERFAGLRPAAG